MSIPKPCGLPLQQILYFAGACAQKLHVCPATDLASLVERLKGTIEYVNPGRLTNSVATISVKKASNPLFAIRLSPLVFPLRKRFCIAHELGHLFLHSGYGARDLEANHSEYSEENSLAETEANWFASGFLIPEATLEKKRKENLSPLDLAAFFQVPLPVLHARFFAI